MLPKLQSFNMKEVKLMGYLEVFKNVKEKLRNRQTTAKYRFARKYIRINSVIEMIEELEDKEFDFRERDRDDNDPLLEPQVSMAYVTAGELREMIKGKRGDYVFLMGVDHLEESFLSLSKRGGSELAKPIKVRRIFRSTIKRL